ncbi:hypothetical protein [Actinomyces sp. W5033]|uniref:variant leucine-rich repeat-containing protein n=1 Tax=Actinomyces sp. W5033 TaxID=3446479 RepID=UPI003EE30CDD
MGPEQLKTAARAASPLIAATTTDQHLQAAIAAERPDLRAALAANPAIYPGLRDWLAEASRRTAAEVVLPPEGAPVADDVAGSAAPGLPEAAELPGRQAPTWAAAPAGQQAPTAWAPPQDLPPDHPTTAHPATVSPVGATPVRRRRHRVWVVVLAGLLILALVGAVTVVALRRWDGRPAPSAPSGSTEPSASATALAGAPALPTASTTSVTVSRCATDPVYEVRAVRDGDGLEVDVHVTATCKDGDVLSGVSNLVTLISGLKGSSLSPSTRVAAAVAVFDLSTDPVAVPASGVDLTFVFGSSFHYVSAAQIAVDSAELFVARDLSGAASAGTATGAVRLSTASAPDAATMDTIWMGVLREQANADLATVSGPLDGTWVPQLSSKKPGLVLDSTTWDAHAVWEHYMSLKEAYPSAILLCSDDWSVFDTGGHWWVVVVAEPFATAEEANAWCTAQGLPRDDCFAKYLKVGASSEGTTVMR